MQEQSKQLDAKLWAKHFSIPFCYAKLQLRGGHGSKKSSSLQYKGLQVYVYLQACFVFVVGKRHVIIDSLADCTIRLPFTFYTELRVQMSEF